MNSHYPRLLLADSEALMLSQWNAVYDAYNEVACLILWDKTPELHGNIENSHHSEHDKKSLNNVEKQAGMKGYVDQLERLGYVLLQDLTVGLILNGLTKYFARFVRNYNMHNMGKTIGKLHAMLIEYEKGLPKRLKHHKERINKFISLSLKPLNLLLKSTLLRMTPATTARRWVIGKDDKEIISTSVPKATNLLGIIHTDVYGPLRHVSRQGASYFITFTDDYSRYGHVYLLKHKHEVFETFKVFKNEVENQFGKTINALRLDRGGEYINQEFKDYLKACGIVQHLTPPYTPQHNGMSERRNRTLLDMVQFMMNLTTLPLSFWDYALESATRILNMVPTKKVDKTPYELCGRAIDLEEIQDEDTSPSKITSEIPVEVEAIRILISITAFYDYEIWQMDVKTAFLDGYEDIYMVHPEGFVDPNHPRKASGSNVTFLVLYVDDIIIMGNHISSLKSIKDYLGKCFAMKDLGEVAFILGIKIYRDRSKRLIGLGQNAYMDKILKRYRMDNSKRDHIPMQERLDLNKTQGASTPEEVKRMQNIPYASAVGSIILVKVTGLDDTKSQTRYVFILNGGTADWKSSKQSTTEMSATEAEYIADLEVAMEAVWIRKFISGLGIVPIINEPIKMFCDNSAPFIFANEPGFKRRQTYTTK
ncbi:retrotransposon protein, putative, ty1-copia subclass [Tanacetum coccineum]